MTKIDPGATLTPHFHNFLPDWLPRKPWYVGSGTSSLSFDRWHHR